MNNEPQPERSSKYHSVLPDQLGPWTQQESINYEVAEDLFGSLIAHCSARIHEAERSSPPDLKAAERWSREQSEWVRRRKQLAFADAEEIKDILVTYSPIVRARYDAVREQMRVRGDLDESPRP